MKNCKMCSKSITEDKTDYCSIECENKHACVLFRFGSIKAMRWESFSLDVFDHINDYAVKQYGDAPNDIAEEYTVEFCIEQAKRYLTRYGKNARPGQEKLDLMKVAHYMQMAYYKLEKGELNEKES